MKKDVKGYDCKFIIKEKSKYCFKEAFNIIFVKSNRAILAQD